MDWIIVYLPSATFALAVRDGRVAVTAPYGKRVLGWAEADAAAYYRRAGATFARF